MGDSVEYISEARFIATEPINFLIMAIQGALTTLRTIYVKERLTQNYNYSINYNLNGSYCYDGNISDPLERRIQSETSFWSMWLAALPTFPPILTAPFLIAASSFIGRKPILIIGAVCHLIASGIFFLVALFDLPLYLTLLAAIVLGLCGDVDTVGAVSAAYITDSSEGTSRTQRMIVLSLMSEVGWGFGQTLGGLILGYSNNFTFSFAFPAIMAAVNLVYTSFPRLVLETVPTCESFSAGTILKKSFHSLAGFYTRFEKSKRTQVIILIVILCLHRFVSEGIFDVVVIYGLGKPFCWTATFVGFFNASVALIPAAVATIVTKPLLKCFSENWLIHFGFISFIAQLITCALAVNTIQLAFIASALGLLRILPEPLCKNPISRLQSPEERER
ncbi:lysosomal proton-coupled steroid conjugate and bile acid symporter SLC46A3-like [Diadema antillarum]|uniref:lysosomal proton-coupled steroid conjugate and bile acid symporter SLC46A3-like n=1 Tax=Diadema antillarum TaxID=105358 RepID=UPI003A8BAB90